jgi:hypothetical protein
MRFRKLPIEVEAFQMTKARRWDNSEWPNWLNEAWQRGCGENGLWCAGLSGNEPANEPLNLGTLEGVYRIKWDDWIIQGVKGELYPCKPDIFSMSYECVDLDEPASDAGHHS